MKVKVNYLHGFVEAGAANLLRGKQSIHQLGNGTHSNQLLIGQGSYKIINEIRFGTFGVGELTGRNGWGDFLHLGSVSALGASGSITSSGLESGGRNLHSIFVDTPAVITETLKSNSNETKPLISKKWKKEAYLGWQVGSIHKALGNEGS